jgi:tetratricopeptide (TPR) repeat protein
MKRREIKPESGATGDSFRYSAAVFSISIPVKMVLAASFLIGAGCAVSRGVHLQPPASIEFYTITAELALARGEPRAAALQYAAAAENDADPKLLQRATEVASQTLQPTIVAKVAQRWISVEPTSADARRAAARAALTLYRIDDAAAHYRMWLATAPDGVDAGLADVETDLTTDENIFGARAVADRLAASYPDSAAAHRVQGLAALRADDPKAAAQSLSLAVNAAQPVAVARSGEGDSEVDAAEARRELLQTWSRARILAGDADEPLAKAHARLQQEDNASNRFDYAVLLMTAQRQKEASEQLEILAAKPESKAAALRLLALLEFQDGHMEAASGRFKQVLRTGKFMDDAFYYLAVIADRNGDPERALQLYSQVKHGENMFPALLRATALLNQHGAPNAAEELLDRLTEDEPQRAPEIVNARARMYADAGELPRASEVLRKAVAEYPDSVELRYARASIYEDQGKIDEALRELSQVLKSRPDDPAALNALGFTLADHSKELGRARKLIERAHSAAPRNAAILDSLGWVLYRQGHFDEALPYLNAAYTDDRGGDIAAHLGEVLWRRGQREDAQRIWSEASIIDADNKLLKSTRQRLQAAP